MEELSPRQEEILALLATGMDIKKKSASVWRSAWGR